MTAAQHELRDARIEGVLAELERRIVAAYPEATFEVFDGEDPSGTYLRAIVDVEDPDAVVDLVVEPLLTLQVREQLPLYFLVARPVVHDPEPMIIPHRQRPHVHS